MSGPARLAVALALERERMALDARALRDQTRRLQRLSLTGRPSRGFAPKRVCKEDHVRAAPDVGEQGDEGLVVCQLSTSAPRRARRPRSRRSR